MSKKETQPEEILDQETPQNQEEQQPEVQEADRQPEPQPAEPEQAPQDSQQDQLAQAEERFLRLAAEYENYRRRTAKEKESIWSDAKAETAAAFLPVYDNLERALKQDTADEAYKKGVEMTMTQLKSVLEKLGIAEIPALGQPFDPKFHNAVMHVEDESLGENTVCEVFQAGFQAGDKVIRFAMVKVAN